MAEKNPDLHIFKEKFNLDYRILINFQVNKSFYICPMILPILSYGSPILRKECDEFEEGESLERFSLRYV